MKQVVEILSIIDLKMESFQHEEQDVILSFFPALFNTFEAFNLILSLFRIFLLYSSSGRWIQREGS